MTTKTEPHAVTEFRNAWARYSDAQRKADEAFSRYFAKRAAGEPTSGAAWQRLENQANYASADVAVAAGRLWDIDIDPQTIIPEYQEC